MTKDTNTDTDAGTGTSRKDCPGTSTHVVTLRSDTVQLHKILKFEGLVQSGAQAKQHIADGDVIVNGAVETRKRRQIHPGDRIVFDGVEVMVVLE